MQLCVLMIDDDSSTDAASVWSRRQDDPLHRQSDQSEEQTPPPRESRHGGDLQGQQLALYTTCHCDADALELLLRKKTLKTSNPIVFACASKRGRCLKDALVEEHKWKKCSSPSP